MSKEHLNYLRRKTADEAELWAADRIEELERQLNQPVIMSEWQTLVQECDELRDLLRPFAALLQEHNGKGPDEQPIFQINEAKITRGDLRRALAATEPKA